MSRLTRATHQYREPSREFLWTVRAKCEKSLFFGPQMNRRRMCRDLSPRAARGRYIAAVTIRRNRATRSIAHQAPSRPAWDQHGAREFKKCLDLRGFCSIPRNARVAPALLRQGVGGHPGSPHRSAGQKLGIKEIDDGIWLASFMHYDLGYFDLEHKTLQPLDNPFGTRLSPMS